MSIKQKVREGNLLNSSINAKDFYNVFPAEKILDRKKLGNQYKYLVKIKDFPEEEATWEPIENLYSVLDMIVKTKNQRRKEENQNLKIKKISQKKRRK